MSVLLRISLYGNIRHLTEVAKRNVSRMLTLKLNQLCASGSLAVALSFALPAPVMYVRLQGNAVTNSACLFDVLPLALCTIGNLHAHLTMPAS
jgi:hypothetical protein